jgi:hypothetical protein
MTTISKYHDILITKLFNSGLGEQNNEFFGPSYFCSWNPKEFCFYPNYPNIVFGTESHYITFLDGKVFIERILFHKKYKGYLYIIDNKIYYTNKKVSIHDRPMFNGYMLYFKISSGSYTGTYNLFLDPKEIGPSKNIRSIFDKMDLIEINKNEL